jgi:hypothetical protein
VEALKQGLADNGLIEGKAYVLVFAGPKANTGAFQR